MDKGTKVLLGSIALGIWMLVLLQGWTAMTMQQVAAEVQAVAEETASIHDHLEPAEDDDADESGARGRHRSRGPGAPAPPRVARTGADTSRSLQ
jgi:hypothetical protein